MDKIYQINRLHNDYWLYTMDEFDAEGREFKPPKDIPCGYFYGLGWPFNNLTLFKTQLNFMDADLYVSKIYSISTNEFLYLFTKFPLENYIKEI